MVKGIGKIGLKRKRKNKKHFLSKDLRDNRRKQIRKPKKKIKMKTYLNPLPILIWVHSYKHLLNLHLYQQKQEHNLENKLKQEQKN